MSRHAFDYQDSRDIQIIGAAWGIGAPDHGCADGPSALQAAGLMKTLQAMQVEVSWLVTLSSSSGECNTLSAVSSDVNAAGPVDRIPDDPNSTATMDGMNAAYSP